MMIFLLGGLFINPAAGAAATGAASSYLQLAGVIHVHTNFSSGRESLDSLVTRAKELGLEVLIPTDHDLVVMEYGLPPFRNLFRLQKSRNSVLKKGPEVYLRAISEANRAHPSVLTIPGIQSSPYYYWTGNPLTGALTAHDYRKELLVIGMEDPGAYRDLPVLHNGFSGRYIKNYLPKTLLFLIALVISIYVYRQQGKFRWAGIGLVVISLLLLLNHHPFQSSLFNPYQGDQGIQGISPWQELIDHAESSGGMVFWAHPESGYSTGGRKIGRVTFITEKYPEALVDSRGYTGFSALYGDTITLTEPGHHWDRMLMQYCEGRRERPPWGIAGADFHGTKAEDPLDTFQTIFLAREKTPAAVRDALRRGRCYAVRKTGQARLTIGEMYAKNRQTEKTATMGQELITTRAPNIKVRLTASDHRSYPVRVTLISNGQTILSREGETPFDLSFDFEAAGTKKTYIRMMAESPRLGKLVANPIFINRSPGDSA